MKTSKILIVAGEASGDRHAADLVKAIVQLKPELEFYGIGGDDMQQNGVRLFYHIRQMAFLGLAEVIRHIPFIRGVFKHLKDWMISEKPEAVILVDYPGFNLRLAKMANRLGIKVIYYICPQLWAWGENRVGKIRKFVDLPLVIFKFEEVFYANHGIKANFVGHPLVDEVEIKLSEKEFRARHGFDPDKPIIALLPGSREHEVNKLLPVMLETIKKAENLFDVQWGLGKANAISGEIYSRLLKSLPNVVGVKNDTHHLIKYAHMALVASGTATLETGYLGTPMVVLYRVSPLTYQIGKYLVKIDNIALANIVSGEKVVPELIQNDLKAENIVAEMNKYFTNPAYYEDVRKKLKKIPMVLGEPGAANRAAGCITEFLEGKPV